ncbi:hypothetical protein K0504_00640 [Neiella marina]|uniref:Galactose-1-phosphate uridylyltransferase n=1 Tax=Neiella holothuriorum TaxID=2870530 RepID=A0ABS7EB95_9GAMM|nr:hypothetical protein [Neiella holothuriorum]MBW8189525.1 hypothetical protein [Neiella holothuriorum]
MKQFVSLQTLKQHLVAELPMDVELSAIIQQLTENSSSNKSIPESHYQIDPRDGTISIFSAARAKRVHTVTNADEQPASDVSCPICDGKLTTVCHIQPLSNGASFITDNLYPVVTPHGLNPDAHLQFGTQSFIRGGHVFGGHFLQWTSSNHDDDWHNMPLADLVLTMQQLAQFAQKLMTEADVMPKTAGCHHGSRGYITLFKNYGAKAGASLSHGHQQLVFANLMSRSSFNNWRFYGRHMETFADYMLRENPNSLQLLDLGDVVLLVPYFMHRPYTMMAFIKDTECSHLHQLSTQQLEQLTEAMQLAIQAIRSELTDDGKPIAFNVTVHTGPGCGLYVEFLPRADTMGGLELQGCWVCQALPADCYDKLNKRIQMLRVRSNDSC